MVNIGADDSVSPNKIRKGADRVVCPYKLNLKSYSTASAFSELALSALSAHSGQCFF